jgi:hypothetical protein
VIEAGFVPIFVELLGRDDAPALQIQCAWALTNIAGGDRSSTQAACDAGAVPLFVRYLTSGNLELVEQCIWGLGNISGDSPDKRGSWIFVPYQTRKLTQLVQIWSCARAC